MNHPKLKILWKVISRKLAAILLLIVSAATAFATLGDGKSKSNLPRSSLLSNRTFAKSGLFSLRSGYSYRGNQVINTVGERRVIRLNTVVTFQKGNTSYVVPLKKNVIFNNVKIDIGNRQFQRN